MKSINPDVSYRTLALFAVAMAALILTPCPAPASDGPAAAADPCAVARDRALTELKMEALAVAGLLDSDAALADSPEYELRETERTVLDEIEAARRDVLERYSACRRDADRGR